MSSSEMQEAERWFAEVWNERNAAAISELMHPSAAGHTHAGEVHGPDEWRERIWEPLMSAFSDLSVEVESMIAHDENVVVRWRVRMKHTGEGLGIPPSGASVDYAGMTWLVIEKRQIVKGWDQWDATGLMLECGASPENLA